MIPRFYLRIPQSAYRTRPFIRGDLSRVSGLPHRRSPALQARHVHVARRKGKSGGARLPRNIFPAPIHHQSTASPARPHVLSCGCASSPCGDKVNFLPQSQFGSNLDEEGGACWRSPNGSVNGCLGLKPKWGKHLASGVILETPLTSCLDWDARDALPNGCSRRPAE